MEKSYWHGRWERHETGWHQSEVEPGLIAYFSGMSPTRIFVPLCGKSMDLAWLASQGHEVVGVELSSVACQLFFEESKIPYQKSQDTKFTLYQSTDPTHKVTLLNGDFFDLQDFDLTQIGAVYDRAALIALPLQMRVAYASSLCQLIRKYADPHSFVFLQIVLDRTPPDLNGPPFSISDSELKSLYGKDFEITLLSRETVDMGDSNLNQTEECVYQMRLATEIGN
jgi:thiopurine S-methyltransferase